MCFIKGLGKENWVHKVAETDITCYKVVLGVGSDEFNSYYYQFRYKLGVDYRSDNIDEYKINLYDRCETIGDGLFHSYIVNNRKVVLKPTMVDRFICWKRGLYSSDWKLCLVECVIPKGSYYWGNVQYNEYASTGIRIVRVIEIIELNDINFNLF